jgi:Uma2 family endonuclease
MFGPFEECRMQERVRPSRRATYADLEAVHPHLVAEIIDGCLVTHPRPAPRHANASSVLGGIINGPFHSGRNGPGGWWILDEPELHLEDDVAVPDIAGWRRERMPRLPDTAYFEQAPAWICETISPSTARYDRGAKRDIYARHGVTHLWHLDPTDRLLETFELRDGLWVLLKAYRDDDAVAAPPFAAVPFQLGLLWAE